MEYCACNLTLQSIFVQERIKNGKFLRPIIPFIVHVVPRFPSTVHTTKAKKRLLTVTSSSEPGTHWKNKRKRNRLVPHSSYQTWSNVVAHENYSTHSQIPNRCSTETKRRKCCSDDNPKATRGYDWSRWVGLVRQPISCIACGSSRTRHPAMDFTRLACRRNCVQDSSAGKREVWTHFPTPEANFSTELHKKTGYIIVCSRGAQRLT